MKSSNRDDGWLTGRLYFNRKDKNVIIIVELFVFLG